MPTQASKCVFYIYAGMQEWAGVDGSERIAGNREVR